MKTWVAIFVTMGYSSAIYMFFVFVRELFRYMTLMIDQEYLLVLSPRETVFYNFFYAFLATLTGLSFGADSFIKTQFQIPRYVRHSVSNDFSGLVWLTNYFIARVAIFLGLFASILPVYVSFDFYKDYWFIFSLLLVVLFFNQWTRYRYFIRKNSLKVMIAFFSATLIYSLLLTALPVFDSGKFNDYILRNTVSYNYRIELPDSNFKMEIRKSSTVQDIFLGYPKHEQKDSVVTIVKRVRKPLTKYELVQWLGNLKSETTFLGQNNLLTALSIDRHVPMSKVKEMLDVLKDMQMNSAIFMTSPFRSGISIRLAPHCFEVKPDTSDWQPSCVELNNEMKKSNAFKVRLAGDSIFLNQELSNLRKLSEQLRAWANKYKGDYFIDIDIDSQSSYGSFITVLDSTFQTIISLRQKYATEHFSKTYDHASTIYEDKQLYDTLSKVYPISLILLSDQERKFINEIK